MCINSCRSQIAEALGKHLASDVFYSCSVRYRNKTSDKSRCRKVSRRNVPNIYENQYSKLIENIPTPDIVITMGCNVKCPVLPCKHREDWGLEDPTGKSDDEFINVIKTIENKILDLAYRIKNNINLI